jgi:hypothetical protein
VKKDNIVKSKSYDKRPAWFKGLNSVWNATYSLGTKVRLDKDKLIKAARKQTGLDDFGKEFNIEPLEILLRSINEEANLHPIGYFISKKRFESLLSIRLRAEWYFKNHPEILDQDLYPVFMIMGLQRTGTTKLHRLLNADPENRVLQSWEAINPVPLKGENSTPDKRLKIAKTSERALKLMAPGFFAIHPVEYMSPEEDILLLDVSYLSTTPEATMHVPTYSSWLEQTDQSAAYEYMTKLLKLLQWQRPAKRWILKSPHHMEFLDLAEKHFRNINFLWTHRNVHESIPSFLSMVCHSRVIFSNDVKMEAVAEHWLRKTGYMLSRGLEYRKTGSNEGKFIDIFYKDFLANTMENLERIYNISGAITPELKKLLEKANIDNPKGKYGIHEYSLRDFGLENNYIDSQTRDYQDSLTKFKNNYLPDNYPTL